VRIHLDWLAAHEVVIIRNRLVVTLDIFQETYNSNAIAYHLGQGRNRSHVLSKDNRLMGPWIT